MAVRVLRCSENTGGILYVKINRKSKKVGIFTDVMVLKQKVPKLVKYVKNRTKDRFLR